jgi:hypothetical protein
MLLNSKSIKIWLSTPQLLMEKTDRSGFSMVSVFSFKHKILMLLIPAKTARQFSTRKTDLSKKKSKKNAVC